MNPFNRLAVRLKESLRAQTMTEYVFVLTAIAVALIVTYQLMGQDLSTMVSRLNTEVSAAA